MTAPHANRFISMIYRYGQRIFARMLRQRQLPVEAGQLPFLFQVYRHPGITQGNARHCTDIDGKRTFIEGR